jgi:hypothetical protein
MKKLQLIFLLLFSFGLQSWGQLFYETGWKSGGIEYQGFLIYYEDNDSYMRVAYTLNGVRKVAEFDCYGDHFTEDGYEGYLLDGSNARIVIGDDGRGYNADNFIFYLENGDYSNPIQIDDYGLQQYDPSKYITHVDYWYKSSADRLTPEFLQNFYNTSDAQYKTLLSLNSAQEISHQQDEFKISELAFGAGHCNTILSMGNAWKKQSWIGAKDFPSQWVRDQWNEGQQITKIIYGDNAWYLTMSDNTGWGLQTYKSEYRFPKDWVSEKWKAGYAITDMSYGGGLWMVVMSQQSGYGYQSWKTETYFPKEWIQQKWDEGYHITSVGFGDGLWGVVMSKGTGYGMQTWKTSPDFPKEWIENQWDANYRITSVSYGQGLWSVVMTTYSGITRQTWDKGQGFPENWVEEKSGGTIEGTFQSEVNVVTNNDPDPEPDDVVVNNGVTKLHLVVVANTNVLDIGTSCDVDKNKTINEINTIGSELGIKVEKHIIAGSNYRKSEVDRVLTGLRPGANDVVMFIYSGHGFRYENQASRYPVIDLTENNYQSIGAETSMHLSKIYDQIVAKGARLNIVIGDCCNTSIGVTERTGEFSLTSRSQSRGKIDRLKTLFLNSRGNMIIAAAQPNESAYGNSRDGGYFTSSFFAALSKETSYLTETTPSWDAIVNRAIESTKYKTSHLSSGKSQNGIYKSTIK